MMKTERIFSILKPDVCLRNIIGNVIGDIEQNGFRIVAIKKHTLTQQEIEQLYEAHINKPFFPDLNRYMMSGPCVLLALEKINGIEDFRNLIGATDPKHAAGGTIRKKYGISIDSNSIHGSESVEAGIKETEMFFHNELTTQI